MQTHVLIYMACYQKVLITCFLLTMKFIAIILSRDLVFLYPIVGQILASFLYDSKDLNFFNSVDEDIRNSSSQRFLVFLKIEIVSVSKITYCQRDYIHFFLLLLAFVRLQFVYRLCSCALFKKKNKFSTVVLSYSVRLYKSLVICYLSWGGKCL